jgi:hypothetical protein
VAACSSPLRLSSTPPTCCGNSWVSGGQALVDRQTVDRGGHGQLVGGGGRGASAAAGHFDARAGAVGQAELQEGREGAEVGAGELAVDAAVGRMKLNCSPR